MESGTLKAGHEIDDLCRRYPDATIYRVDKKTLAEMTGNRRCKVLLPTTEMRQSEGAFALALEVAAIEENGKQLILIVG